MADLRRALVVLAILMLISAAAHYWSDAQRSQLLLSDSFERGIDGWTPGYDLPDDANNPGHKVAWNITVSNETSRVGLRALKMYVDGRQDDGTVWLQRTVAASANQTVTLSLWAYSQGENFNTHDVVVAYIGAQPPKGEGSFEVLGPGDSWTGWKQYIYTAKASGEGGTLYVAFGISVRWETDIVQYFDDVTLTS